jgi:hypothetical protein
MALNDELARAAAAALAYARPGEGLVGVLAAEPYGGRRLYLCAFQEGDQSPTWLALEDSGEPVAERSVVREAASIVAMCELAEESAGGGELEELRSRLVTLRLTERPAGVEEAEAAALALEQTIGAPPRVASPVWLDAVGAATQTLERALGDRGPSPFAAAMREGVDAVEQFVDDVEAGYRITLDVAG